MSLPSAVTPSTRPPSASSRSPSRRVPAWKILTSGSPPADQALFDDDLGAGRARPAFAERGIDRGIGFGQRGTDGDALAGGQAVGLDHDRRPLLGDVRLGRGGLAKPAIGGGRDRFARAK